MNRDIVVGVTGASGAAYARRLIECLAGAGMHIHLVVSPHGRRLFADELDLAVTPEVLLPAGPAEAITTYSYTDIGARIASGSFRTAGMVVCPCSAHTLGAIAAGLGENLLHRAAQVTLKELRRLALVYREMPMSAVDLRNALALSQAGAVICPANPGFYMRPQSVGDLVDFVVGKILDLFDIDHSLQTRWEP